MINSATALRMLKSHVASRPIADEKLGAIGFGIYSADLKLWLAQRGFRVDTARSTFVRWTETWTATGDMIPIKVNGNTIAFWFAEVPRNIATMVAQMGDTQNLQCIYDLSLGVVTPRMCEGLGIVLGGFY